MPRDGTSREPEHHRDDGEGGGEDGSRKKAVIALLVVLGLVVSALYVGHVLKHSSSVEDCEMQGRTNCEPIDTGK